MKLSKFMIVCAVAFASALAACGANSSNSSTPIPTSIQRAHARAAHLASSDNQCPSDLAVSVVYAVSKNNELHWVVHEKQMAKGAEARFVEQVRVGARQLTESERADNAAPKGTDVVWVYPQEEAPPCRMEKGELWGVAHGDGPPMAHVVSELSGSCPLTDEHTFYIAIPSDGQPTGCRLHAIPNIASDTTGQGTPVIPASIKPLLPAHTCEKSDCFRWIYNGAQVDNGAGVYELTAVWLRPADDDEPECATPFDGFHGVFYRPNQRSSLQRIPDAMGLRAILYDEAGIKGIVTDSRGQLGLFLPAKDSLPRLASKEPYVSWNEENRSEMEELEPSCR